MLKCVLLVLSLSVLQRTSALQEESSRNGRFLGRLEKTEAAVQQQTAGSPRMNAKEQAPLMQKQQKRRVGFHQNDLGLKSAMREMMDDDDEEDSITPFLDSGRSPKGAAFLQEPGPRSDDAYMQDSAEGLSAALGPRWNSHELEDTADRNTKAFLSGIANPNALQGLNGMMATMMHLR